MIQILKNIDNANMGPKEYAFLAICLVVIIGSSILFGKLNSKKA